MAPKLLQRFWKPPMLAMRATGQDEQVCFAVFEK